MTRLLILILAFTGGSALAEKNSVNVATRVHESNLSTYKCYLFASNVDLIYAKKLGARAAASASDWILKWEEPKEGGRANVSFSLKVHVRNLQRTLQRKMICDFSRSSKKYSCGGDDDSGGIVFYFSKDLSQVTIELEYIDLGTYEDSHAVFSPGEAPISLSLSATNCP